MRRIIVTYLFAICCVPPLAFADGREDYSANCAACHGANGKASGEKAKAFKMDARKLDLKASRMGKDGMIMIIQKGKGHMPGYDDYLTVDQISDIADYILILRKQ